MAMPAGYAPDMASQEKAREKMGLEELPAVGPDPQSTRQTPPSTAKNTPANQRLPRPEPGIAALLSTAAGPLDSLEVLRRVGLTPLPDGAGDFKLTGHERWPEIDYWKLMGWLRHNGQWVQMALDNGVKKITEEHKIAAAEVIASLVDTPSADEIIPSVFDERLVPQIAKVIV